MVKESLSFESGSNNGNLRIIKSNFTNQDESKRDNKPNLSVSPPESPTEERINTQWLIKSEDRVSNSSLNSDSSDNENNNITLTKTSLLNFRDVPFRRLSSPAVLEKKEPNKQEYYTLQDYLNKNFCVRDNSFSLPDAAHIAESGTALNYISNSHRPTNTNDNSKEKKLQKIRLFFIEYCLYKLILCLPFGFLTTISILGLKGDPIIFVCYIIIFTLVVFYPFACLLWLTYKLLLPYYQMCRYTPNASSAEKLPEKGEGDIEYKIPTILTEKSIDSAKSLSQTVYERRRSLPARRPSTLPAIEEIEASSNDEEEEEEEHEDHTWNKNRGNKQSVDKQENSDSIEQTSI